MSEAHKSTQAENDEKLLPDADVVTAIREEKHSRIGHVLDGTVNHAAYVGRSTTWAIGRGVRFVGDAVGDLINGIRKKPAPRKS